MNFIPQSNLSISNYELPQHFKESVSNRATLRLSLIYLILWTLAGLVFLLSPTLGLALAFPGGGFAASEHPLLFLTGTAAAFGIAIFLWFATGNVLGPFLVWAAAIPLAFSAQANPVMPSISHLIFASGPVLLMGLWALKFALWKYRKLRLGKLNINLLSAPTQSLLPQHSAQEERPELSPTQMSQLRFFLDRALQPVSEFEGFEQLDDFQTAAVRYQINFISYALSMAQYKYLPALGAYLTEAQFNLKAKQEQPEVWRYWAKESAWGNLELSRDPVAKDNIMYSGFVGTQMMMARKASPHHPVNFMDRLEGTDKEFKFSYSLRALIEQISQQYKTAKFGLLPCEPNWIYPLCNFITAAAIRGYDTECNTHYWAEIKSRFRTLMDQEFLGFDGHFIPFRSAYTGLAAPQIGGLVMQTFPCFFLNALYPDIARRQWRVMRKGIEDRSLRQACWPIDVGNYKFSRAAGYGASALAAAEMGDTDLKNKLLNLMEEDCAPVLHNGRQYYSNASLWANANAFMAGLISEGDFHRLMNRKNPKAGPYIHLADVNDVMFSSAYQSKGALFFKASSQNGPGYKSIQIAGLIPHQTYQLVFDGTQVEITPDTVGKAELNLPLFGENRFQLIPKP